MNKYIVVKQIRSIIGLPKRQRLLLKSVGLKKINQKIYVKNNAMTKSILFRIQHLVSIENKYIENSS